MNFAIDANGTVAMVDDNPGDLELARTCFEMSRLTNPWLQFERGADLLSYLDSAKRGEHAVPALVLLDINMPHMNGHQVLERVRSDHFYDSMPVFCMLTGSQEPSDRGRAVGLGANGFMVKPDSLQEFVDFFNSLTGAT